MTQPAPHAADPSAVLAVARAWIGTPYLHQSSVLGVGADCLGLARGIWRALHGEELWDLPPYSRDWGEVGGREVLAEAARAALIEIPVEAAGPGALVLFRMGPGSPAKHCGVLGESLIRPSFVHAYDRTGVVEEPLTEAWARRAAYAFLFPAPTVPSAPVEAAPDETATSPEPVAAEAIAPGDEAEPTPQVPGAADPVEAAPDAASEGPAAPETGGGG